MRTKESGSLKRSCSFDPYIEELIIEYCNRFSCTYSSFIRLGIMLAAKRLEHKEKEKGLKLIGAR
jgi:hypothetical protein